MKYLRYLALVSALLVLPTAFAQAEVRFGVGVGFGPGYIAGPPACAYGYYSDYPYACAPYGYYGPEWFADGIFIGAGPWYHRYYGHPYWGNGYYGRSYYGRGYDRDDHRFYARPYDGRRFDGRGFEGRDHDRGFRGGDSRGHEGGYRGGRR